jgi:hypothetical protein
MIEAFLRMRFPVGAKRASFRVTAYSADFAMLRAQGRKKYAIAHAPRHKIRVAPGVASAMKIIRLALVALIGLALSGCYELMEPVLTKGAYAPIAGRFACSDSLTGKMREDVFAERKNGFFFPDYRYDASDGSELTFQAIDDKFFLVQRTPAGGAPNAAYAQFVGDKNLVLFVPNILAKSDAIEALAKANKVATSFVASGALRLIGEKADVLAFLRAHDRSLLTVLSECKRL